jgi:sugar phosphate isomerase/epimerase
MIFDRGVAIVHIPVGDEIMKRGQCGVAIATVVACLVYVLIVWVAPANSAGRVRDPEAANLWAHDNLVAWCVVPFDAKNRGPEERAQMLNRLGFTKFAYDWRPVHVATFDAEIETLKKHNIDLLAWWFPLDADDPAAKAILQIFKRHDVHPQLWVALPRKEAATPASGNKMPVEDEHRAFLREIRQDLATTRQEQETRVKHEADRINALVKLAAPYGCKVELYNHNGWFGMVDNQIAIIKYLKELGVTDVGMVYNFSHARDEFHDDTQHFAPLWKKIMPYVVVVNITGTYMDGTSIYLSQGDRELEMMRIIQDSGWRGPVGLIAEKGGDAEITLRNYLVGLDWLAAELARPGSGGARPFPAVPK